MNHLLFTSDFLTQRSTARLGQPTPPPGWTKQQHRAESSCTAQGTSILPITCFLFPSQIAGGFGCSLRSGNCKPNRRFGHRLVQQGETWKKANDPIQTGPHTQTSKCLHAKHPTSAKLLRRAGDHFPACTTMGGKVAPHNFPFQQLPWPRHRFQRQRPHLSRFCRRWLLVTWSAQPAAKGCRGRRL